MNANNLNTEETKLFCACCENEMRIFTQNENWLFYRCPECGFWTTRTVNGLPPHYDYDDDATFDKDASTQ